MTGAGPLVIVVKTRQPNMKQNETTFDRGEFVRNRDLEGSPIANRSFQIPGGACSSDAVGGAIVAVIGNKTGPQSESGPLVSWPSVRIAKIFGVLSMSTVFTWRQNVCASSKSLPGEPWVDALS